MAEMMWGGCEGGEGGTKVSKDRSWVRVLASISVFFQPFCPADSFNIYDDDSDDDDDNEDDNNRSNNSPNSSSYDIHIATRTTHQKQLAHPNLPETLDCKINCSFPSHSALPRLQRLSQEVLGRQRR